jgi:hypothetical protein
MAELNLVLVGGGAIARAHAAAVQLVPFYFPDVALWRPRLVCGATQELGDATATRLGLEEGMVGWDDAAWLAGTTPTGLRD